MLRRQLPVYSPLSWEAIAAGARAAVSGDAGGELRARVDALIRERYLAHDVLLLDSGTSALHLAIEGAVDTRGRVVALPGYSCYDLATAAEGADARVVLYDVDPGTLGPDPDSLERALDSKPAAVVVAHLFGHLVDVAAIAQMLESALPDALLIEDAAQGVGGTLRGRPLGSFGSVSVLSFGRGKGMTGGGGGALLAHDERGVEIVERARGRLDGDRGPRGSRRVALLLAQHVLGRPSVYGLPSSLPFLHLGETVYRPPAPPGHVGLASLAVLERVVANADRELDVRRASAAELLRAMEESQLVRPPAAVSGGEPGYLRLPVVGRDRATTMRMTAEGRRLGVARGYPTTLAALPTLRRRLVEREPHLAGCIELAERLLTLPTHGLLAPWELTTLQAWVGKRG